MIVYMLPCGLFFCCCVPSQQLPVLPSPPAFFYSILPSYITSITYPQTFPHLQTIPWIDSAIQASLHCPGNHAPRHPSATTYTAPSSPTCACVNSYLPLLPPHCLITRATIHSLTFLVHYSQHPDPLPAAPTHFARRDSLYLPYLPLPVNCEPSSVHPIVNSIGSSHHHSIICFTHFPGTTASGILADYIVLPHVHLLLLLPLCVLLLPRWFSPVIHIAFTTHCPSLPAPSWIIPPACVCATIHCMQTVVHGTLEFPEEGRNHTFGTVACACRDILPCTLLPSPFELTSPPALL